MPVSPILILNTQSGENLIISYRYILSMMILYWSRLTYCLSKGKWSCTSHLLYNFMPHVHLSSSFHSCLPWFSLYSQVMWDVRGN